eukprot:2057215-Amphidinium_carterae.1
MFNEICQQGGGNSLITRDVAVLRIRIEEGVDAIHSAVRDMEYTTIFVVCGGDALAWNMPPVWNKMAGIAARRSDRMAYLPSQVEPSSERST